MAPASQIGRLAPEFRILVAGNELPQDAAADLIGATVEEDVDVPGMFTFQLTNWDMAKQKFTWSDKDTFAPGVETQVQMGYNNKLETLITGDITGLEPEFSGDGVPIVTIRGYDRRHRMMRGTKTRTFLQLKDSDIASQLAGEAGLQSNATDSSAEHEYLLQHNQSDMEFLTARARRIGYEVLVDDKTLIFRPRPPAASASVTLGLGDDLIEFFPRLSTMGQFTKVEVRSWDSKQAQLLSATASAGDESPALGKKTGPSATKNIFGEAPTAITDDPVRTQGEVDKMAPGRLQDIAMDYITGHGTSIGRTDLRAGKVIQLNGLGDRFSGLYYVMSTRHCWTTTRGYRTGFTVRRNAS